MISNGNIRAIIWDYDGTLVDTRRKNLNVTRRIIESIVETGTAEFSALQSLENYHLANRVLVDGKIDVKIISIGAFYDVEPDISKWQVRPDDEAQRVDDILDIVDRIES